MGLSEMMSIARLSLHHPRTNKYRPSDNCHLPLNLPRRPPSGSALSARCATSSRMLNVAFASLTGRRKKIKDQHVFNSDTQAVVKTR